MIPSQYHQGSIKRVLLFVKKRLLWIVCKGKRCKLRRGYLSTSKPFIKRGLILLKITGGQLLMRNKAKTGLTDFDKWLLILIIKFFILLLFGWFQRPKGQMKWGWQMRWLTSSIRAGFSFYIVSLRKRQYLRSARPKNARPDSIGTALFGTSRALILTFLRDTISFLTDTI